MSSLLLCTLYLCAHSPYGGAMLLRNTNSFSAQETIMRQVLDILNTPVPKSSTQIARALVDIGIYNTKYPNKLGHFVSHSVLPPLVNDNLVVVFKRGTEPWKEARTLNVLFNGIKPRRFGDLYQSNFLVSFGANLLFVPSVDPMLNLSAMAFLHKLGKGNESIIDINLGDLLYNFIYCGKFTDTRNNIRLSMYKSKIDFATIDFLEKLLDFGLNLPKIPFKPDIDSAKTLLRIVEMASEPGHKRM